MKTSVSCYLSAIILIAAFFQGAEAQDLDRLGIVRAIDSIVADPIDAGQIAEHRLPWFREVTRSC